MMDVYVVNDRLEDFTFSITSVEEDGLDIFLNAKNLWNDDWREYVVWHNNRIIQRVFNPDILTFGD